MRLPPDPVVGRRVRWFHLCGVAGLVCAVALAVGLAAAGGRSVPVALALCALAVAVFLALAAAAKALTGGERLVYYHHEWAVLGSCAVALASAGEPVLAHLDGIALGLGAFLACGRLGCLGAGCCFGRPAGRGVRYRAAHVAAGFPAHLAGARLAPVQLWEAAGVAAIVATGAVVARSGAAAGSALVLYLEAYAVLRFVLEERRGDGVRPVWLGVSEAQWSSVCQSLVVAALAAAGVLPGGPFPAVVAAALAAGVA
ncbi:MAG: prolipoprotein diacylglyceryl transferase family protein, partial [Solirubrobacteraceae bacterium]